MTLVGLFVRLLGVAAAVLPLVFRDNILKSAGIQETLVSHYAFNIVGFGVGCALWSWGKRLDQRLNRAGKT